jgi:hypothetical protein
MGDIWQSAGACSGFEFQPIGGRWRAGRFIRNLLNTNPLIGQALVEMTLMSARDVAEAYQSASAALYKTGQGFDARREEIIPWLIDEVSSSRLKASIAGQSARGVMLDAASFPYRVVGRILNADIAGKEYLIYRRPLSMIDISTLWTSSLHLIQRSLASVQGNAAVAKPAGDMSVGGVLVLGEIFVEVGRWAFFIGRLAWAEISAITLPGIRYSGIFHLPVRRRRVAVSAASPQFRTFSVSGADLSQHQSHHCRCLSA